jgi:3-oxoacyl-[acyl-carrier protein] reductase
MAPKDCIDHGEKTRCAVVTGSAQGIGFAYARGFAKSGYRTILSDIDGPALARATASLQAEGLSGDYCECDVSDERQVSALFESVAGYGQLRVLVNNAAIVLGLPRPFKPFYETELSEWNTIMGVNAGGTFLCCKYAWPLFAQDQEGSIINVTSDAIWKGYEDQLAYFASKGAVAVMTRSLAREFGAIGVRVNAIAPGMTLSASTLQSQQMQDVRPLVERSCAIQREQHPDDLVGTAIFLASEASACITGQTIVVNCGAVMV